MRSVKDFVSLLFLITCLIILIIRGELVTNQKPGYFGYPSVKSNNLTPTAIEKVFQQCLETQGCGKECGNKKSFYPSCLAAFPGCSCPPGYAFQVDINGNVFCQQICFLAANYSGGNPNIPNALQCFGPTTINLSISCPLGSYLSGICGNGSDGVGCGNPTNYVIFNGASYCIQTITNNVQTPSYIYNPTCPTPMVSQIVFVAQSTPQQNSPCPAVASVSPLVQVPCPWCPVPCTLQSSDSVRTCPVWGKLNQRSFKHNYHYSNPSCRGCSQGSGSRLL